MLRCALLGLAAIAAAEPAKAAFPGANGKIIFTNGINNREVFGINDDGSGMANLSNNAAVLDMSPSWSADGEKIAFGSSRNGTVAIFVMNADGSGQASITGQGDRAENDPAWSPDGQKIAFTSIEIGAGSRGFEIFVADADGGNATNLTSNGHHDERPAWSPDGQKIAYERGDIDPSINRPGPSQIHVMNANGSGDVDLTPDGSVEEHFPAWSPDGKKIAFSSAGEILVMNPDGSGRTNLTRNPAGDATPVWSPDGKKIAFLSARGGVLGLYVMNADGSNQRLLGAAPEASEADDWQPLPDRDGDSLLDSWEIDGIDVDGDNFVDVDLPAMGADPDHKDIFIEIDPMGGHELAQVAIDGVTAAFGAAPVSNPDMSPGIRLHVDNGPGSTMDPVSGATWGSLSEQNTLSHQTVLGTLNGDEYDWTEFDQLKDGNFSDERERAFHYAISGHAFGSASNDSSGISRGIDASDFLVTLGPASEPGEGSGTLAQQAGTLMHELGHNLGLRHGGNDDTNYKATYLSVMNYSFQFRGIFRTTGSPFLDYSQVEVSLDEADLDENTGFGYAPGSPQAGFRTIYACPNGDLRAANLVAGGLDWNCSGGPLEGPVSSDLNADGSLTAFTPFLDWPALVYDGGEVGAGGGDAALSQTTEMIEPQLDELLENERVLDAGPLPLPSPLLPPPQGPAPGGGATADDPPDLSALSVSPRAFPAARRGSTIGGPASVRYRASGAGFVRFTAERQTTGRRVRGRCVPATRRNRRARRCVRHKAVRGSFIHSTSPGANRLRFSGRLAARALAAGTYRLVATPLSPSARRPGAPLRAGFRIVRPRR